jgi:hypothetical protein
VQVELVEAIARAGAGRISRKITRSGADAIPERRSDNSLYA